MTIGNKRKRRRGKQLVPQPFSAVADARNQEFRCQVRREQPFRGSTNDVAQVCARCNADDQFLYFAPADRATEARAAPSLSTSIKSWTFVGTAPA